MTPTKPTPGQTLLLKIEAWLKGYIASKDANVHLVLALWALHTHWSERFEASPRLTITGTPGSGKTRIGLCVALLSRAGRVITDITPAAFFTRMDNMRGQMTMIIDEAERFQGGAATLIRAVLNAGYQPGAVVDRKMPNGAVVDFNCYGPMGCIAVGEPTPTLRTRSIIIRAQAGTPQRNWMRVQALGEAAALRTEIEAKGVWLGRPVSRYPSHLKERDQEIWSAIYGVADALGLDAATLERVDVFSTDNARYKADVAAKRYQAVEAEKRDEDRGDRVLAVEGMKIAVDGLTGSHIQTIDLVERMKAIPTAPWRTYRGIGLDGISLASLVSPFGITPKHFKVPAKERKRPGEQQRGYDVKMIRAINLDHIRTTTITTEVAPDISQAE